MAETSIRRVLIFGKTGSGKSTLANMLVSGGLDEQRFAMGDSMQGVTNKCSTLSGSEYEVTDTVGLGEETDSERKDAKRMIIHFLKITRCSYHHIIFVKRAGRQDKLDTALWKIFLKTFKGDKKANFHEDAYRGMVLVLTGCPNPENWLDAEKGHLEENYKEVKKRFIGVDFPPISDDAEVEIHQSRRRSNHLMILKQSLDKLYHENGELAFEPRYSRLNDLELEQFAEKLLEQILKISRGVGIAVEFVLKVLFVVGASLLVNMGS
ncbi:hypothetical protein R1flu_027188 [Riccia fluitans]|uniref:AIG1-type G domain-containing protein n=1 Tax=Riccia fluitans TaxID=41844 RepID=A0ABD1XI35_9MARC